MNPVLGLDPLEAFDFASVRRLSMASGPMCPSLNITACWPTWKMLDTVQ
jgi:hypothetical protein